MTALQAAVEFGGFDLKVASDIGMDADAVRDYFSSDNFRNMFPEENPEMCDGYTLNECANAVIKELGL